MYSLTLFVCKFHYKELLDKFLTKFKSIMKKLGLLVLFAILFFFLSSFQSLEEWKRYQFKAGNFKIMLPNRPNKAFSPIQTQSEGINYKITFKKKENDILIAHKTLDKKIEQYIQQFKNKENYEVLVENEQSTLMQNFPAKEVKIRLISKNDKSEKTILYRVLLTPKYEYNFTIKRPDNFVDYERAGKLFNSFQLMK